MANTTPDVLLLFQLMLIVIMPVVYSGCGKHGSYRSWEPLEFNHIFQAWKVLESGLGSGKLWKCE